MIAYKPATCIGARALPPEEYPRLRRCAGMLEAAGYTLRSGAADGSDRVFESVLVHPDRAEIFLPWPRFNGHASPRHQPSERAIQLAAEHHPAWHRCSAQARLLHARNSHQLLGEDLTSPSLFVVCWTPSAAVVGGTGQALRLAQALGIPIYNLADRRQGNALARRLQSEMQAT